MSLEPYWKKSDADFVFAEVKGQSKTFSFTIPDYLAAMRYPNSIHNFIKFCLDNKLSYRHIDSKDIEIILYPEKNFDSSTKNMMSFVDARDKIKKRICNNQIIPFHEPWILRQLSPEQRYQYGYIGIKGNNLEYIMPQKINKSPQTREDKEWTKIHNMEYICKVVKRAINQTYWNDGDEKEIKMDINFSSNIVFSPTFPQIIVACEYPYLYFEYIHDYSRGKKIGYSTFLQKALVYGYLIVDKCKIFPKGKISYFEPIDSLDDFETLKFADRMNFLTTEAYPKWLAGEPIPEYKDDIEREKRIKEKEILEKTIQLNAYMNVKNRTEFYERAIENKSNFTTKQLKFEVDRSLSFLANCEYAGDSVYDQKKENLLNLMKTAFKDPVLNDIMLNSYKELEGKLDDCIKNSKSDLVKKESTQELKNLKSVGLFLGIEKDHEQSKCCYLI